MKQDHGVRWLLVCILIVLLMSCTPSPTPASTSFPLLAGDPRAYLPDLSEMPAGYVDVSSILGADDLSSYGGKSGSVAYGKLPAEYAQFVAIVSPDETQAKDVYQRVIAHLPVSLSVPRELTGFSEYKIIGDRVGTNPNGYTVFITYRYLNIVGSITVGAPGLSQEDVTQKAVQFAGLIPPKFKK